MTKGEVIMSKINDFITNAGMYFLATVDGKQPKLRPLGSNYEEDAVAMLIDMAGNKVIL